MAYLPVLMIVLQVVVLLVQWFFQPYLGKKGANLAVKQDIKDITTKIESVKTELQVQFSLREGMLKVQEQICQTFHDLRLILDDLAARYGPDGVEGKASYAERQEVNQHIATLNTLLARLFLIVPDEEWEHMMNAFPLTSQQYNDFMYACIDAMRRNSFPDTRFNAEQHIRRLYELKLENAPDIAKR